jgi:hypothetical protein
LTRRVALDAYTNLKLRGKKERKTFLRLKLDNSETRHWKKKNKSSFKALVVKREEKSRLPSIEVIRRLNFGGDKSRQKSFNKIDGWGPEGRSASFTKGGGDAH